MSGCGGENSVLTMRFVLQTALTMLRFVFAERRRRRAAAEGALTSVLLLRNSQELVTKYSSELAIEMVPFQVGYLS